MSLVEKKTKVIKFFETFIEGYILNDLKALVKIEPDNMGFGGCTIPTAMTIISSMELIGFLLNKNGKIGNSTDNISQFLTYDQPPFFSNYDSNTIDKLSNYRQGMMHHFFPKFKGDFAGITKSKDKSLFILQKINGHEVESLNVSVLAKDFSEAIDKLKNFLKITEDDETLDTILKGLKGLDYFLHLPSTVTDTTIHPGTPKNK